MARIVARSCGIFAFVLAAAGVTYGTAHPQAMVQNKVADQALKDRIERKLQTDPNVRKYDIRVKVDDSDVTLDGTVATDEQKSDAEHLARIAGVDDVHNHLNVDKDADQTLANRAAKGLRRTGEAVNDAWITSKVKWFFVDEPLLDGSKIDVDTKRRVVTLDGKVPSDDARARAVELANDADGVDKVIDKLKVDKD
jgi:osmotically-inducible protein OsmY